jgi:hypothetical protein
VTAIYTATRLSQQVFIRPEPSQLYVEILRSRELADERPRIEPYGRTLYVRNNGSRCQLSLVGEAWQGSCTYGRTHDPEIHPCCEARALERWYNARLIPDPHLLILDYTLLTGGRHAFEQGSAEQAVYDKVCDGWRQTAQEHARGQNWDGTRLQQWYLLCTAQLVCPDDRLIAQDWQSELARVQRAWAYDLPDWFEAVRAAREALVQYLRRGEGRSRKVSER